MDSPTRVIFVAEGEDLVPALRALEGAWVSAVGSVQDVELAVSERAFLVKGALTLAQLSGPAAGPHAVVLSRVTDTGLEVLAGELTAARSAGVHVAVLSGEAAKTIPAAAHKKESDAEGWASQARNVAEDAREDEPEEPPLPEAGDLVDHFAFGLCEVLMAADERLKIRDLHGPGRIREIRAEMLIVKGPTERDGKRFFKLERRH